MQCLQKELEGQVAGGAGIRASQYSRGLVAGKRSSETEAGLDKLMERPGDGSGNGIWYITTLLLEASFWRM